MFNLFKKNRCKVGFHKKGDKCFKTNSKVKKIVKALNCSGKDKKRLECSVQKPLRPIIPYFGGNQRVANKIISKFPKHHTYVEPFVGGGSVYWANTQSYIVKLKGAKK